MLLFVFALYTPCISQFLIVPLFVRQNADMFMPSAFLRPLFVLVITIPFTSPSALMLWNNGALLLFTITALVLFVP